MSELLNTIMSRPEGFRTQNGEIALSAESYGVDIESKMLVLWDYIGISANPAEISAKVDVVLKEIPHEENLKVVEDLFVMLFETRDPRKGRGRKKSFDIMLMKLYSVFPQLTRHIMYQIPNYGCFSDIVRCYNLSNKYPYREAFGNAGIESSLEDLSSTCVSIFYDAIIADREKLLSGENQLSLAAKFIPREKSANYAMAVSCSKALYPDSVDRMKSYRKLIALLNSKLDTVEVKMCGRRWREIDFDQGRVPGVAMNKYKKSFRCAGKNKNAIHLDDRHECKRNFEMCLSKITSGEIKNVIHGNVLTVQSLVLQYFKQAFPTTTSCYYPMTTLPIRQEIEIELAIEDMVKNCKSKGKLEYTIAMPDTSGSMTSDGCKPLAASIGIAHLIMRSSNFDKAITFDTSPNIVDFSDCGEKLYKRMNKMMDKRQFNWGGSTNIHAAFDLVLSMLKNNRVPPQEVKNLTLVVLTDMQFDQSRNDKWSLTYEKIKAKFLRSGYSTPCVVWWNLNGSLQQTFVNDAHTRGVKILSGFSHQLLKTLIEGEHQDTPEMTMMKQLSNDHYQAVRETVRDYVNSHGIS